jgi:hypothetical protein
MKITRDTCKVALVFILPILLACGTLEIGIERAPKPTAVASTDTAMPVRTSLPITLIAPYSTIAPPTATAADIITAPASRERITFAAGTSTTSFPVFFTRGVLKAYLLTILAQQQLFVDADGDVTIVVLDSQNRLIVPVTVRPGHWVGVNPLKGDCTIILRGDGMINLTINAPPLGG